MRTQHRTSDTKTAIGYVRVSTQEQATEGVSLDAQRDRIRAYCRLHAIKLIDIKADEGISGGTLNRRRHAPARDRHPAGGRGLSAEGGRHLASGAGACAAGVDGCGSIGGVTLQSLSGFF